MNITEHKEPEAWILTLMGALDEHADLPDRVGTRLDDAAPAIIIELSGVPMITSAGLSQLVQLTARANTQNIPFLLAAPTPFVQGVFETTRLDRFFQIHEHTRAAIQALKNRNPG